MPGSERRRFDIAWGLERLLGVLVAFWQLGVASVACSLFPVSVSGVLGVGRGMTRGSGREDGSLGFPFGAVLGGLLPVFVGWVITYKGVFETGDVAPVLGVSVSVRFLLLTPPPGNITMF